jgi:hypothetical protein
VVNVFSKQANINSNLHPTRCFTHVSLGPRMCGMLNYFVNQPQPFKKAQPQKHSDQPLVMNHGSWKCRYAPKSTFLSSKTKYDLHIGSTGFDKMPCHSHKGNMGSFRDAIGGEEESCEIFLPQSVKVVGATCVGRARTARRNASSRAHSHR